MSDVVVSVIESVTNVSVVENQVVVDVTESPVQVTVGNSGPQGASYEKGDPIYTRVRNATGATLLKGTVVYTSGANGNHVQVDKALATSDATSARTLGFVADDIPNNGDGLVCISGELTGIDTDGASAGDIVYLSGTVAGGWTTVKPVAPIHLVYLGVVTRPHANGSIYVHPQNGYEIGELHDVAITSPADNQVLTYDSASGLWKNKSNPVDGVSSIVFESPLTGGTVTSTGTVGLDQSALTVAESQVTGLVSDLASKANLAGANFSGNISSPIASASYVNVQNTVGATLNSGETQIRSSSPDGTKDIRVWNRNDAGGFYYSNSGGTSANVLRFDHTVAGRMAVQFVSDFTSGNSITGTTGRVNILASTASQIGAVIRGAASQTGDLMQFQNSAGTVVGRIAADGAYVAGNASASFISGASWRLQIQPASAATVAATFRGAASQSANLQEWQDSAGTILGRYSSGGSFLTSGYVQAGSQSAGVLGQLTAYAGSASVIGAVIRGAASQTANLQEWQNSAGSVLAKIDSAGGLTVSVAGNAITTPYQGRLNIAGAVYGSTPYFGSVNVQQEGGGHAVALSGRTGSASAILYARAVDSVNIGAVIRGAASQTANLQEWQDSAGTVLASINSGGGVRGLNIFTNTAYAGISEENSGGFIRLTKVTSGTNPAAGQGKLYFRDGTNAGTLKLVVRAGAAGAETTILDNIPQ